MNGNDYGSYSSYKYGGGNSNNNNNKSSGKKKWKSEIFWNFQIYIAILILSCDYLDM